jgi:hypothetical protein
VGSDESLEADLLEQVPDEFSSPVKHTPNQISTFSNKPVTPDKIQPDVAQGPSFLDRIAQIEWIQLIFENLANSQETFSRKICQSIIEVLQDRPAMFMHLKKKLMKSIAALSILIAVCALSWTLFVMICPLYFIVLIKVVFALNLLICLKAHIEKSINQFMLYHRTCARALSRVQEQQLLAKYNESALA